MNQQPKIATRAKWKMAGKNGGDWPFGFDADALGGVNGLSVFEPGHGGHGIASGPTPQRQPALRLGRHIL